jgi:hypothetical protein
MNDDLIPIQAVFEVALASLPGAQIPTVWENIDRPDTGPPYKEVYLLPAEPDNPEIGDGYIQRGILQINLFYPQGKGWFNSLTQAQVIRTAFPRGLALQNGSVIVTVLTTPEIGPGRAEDDLYFRPVKVRWSAQFFGG